jgi:hypothetical protein
VVPEHPEQALANAVSHRVEVGRPTLGFGNTTLVPFPCRETRPSRPYGKKQAKGLSSRTGELALALLSDLYARIQATGAVNEV